MDKNKTMKLEYDLTFDDCMAYQRYYIRTGRQVRRVRNIIRWFFPLLFLSVTAAVGVDFADPENVVRVAFILAVSVGWFLIMPGWYTKSLEKRVRKTSDRPENSSFTGACVMEPDDEGLSLRRDDTESRIGWDGFIGWTEAGDHAFFHISPRSAFVVPLAKISPADAEDLRELARRQIGEPVEHI